MITYGGSAVTRLKAADALASRRHGCGGDRSAHPAAARHADDARNVGAARHGVPSSSTKGGAAAASRPRSPRVLESHSFYDLDAPIAHAFARRKCRFRTRSISRTPHCPATIASRRRAARQALRRHGRIPHALARGRHGSRHARRMAEAPRRRREAWRHHRRRRHATRRYRNRGLRRRRPRPAHGGRRARKCRSAPCSRESERRA